MKNRFLLKTFILLVVLVVGSLNVWAQVYDLVTDVSSLAAGDVILITNSKDAGSVYALGTTQNTNNRKAESVTVSNDKISALGNAQEITLEKKNNSGNYTFKVGSKYLYAASSSANQLKSGNSEAYWEITINTTTHVAAITDKTNTSNRNKMDYNPNNQNPIFSCYSSISNNLFVFKKHTYTITAISNNNSYGTVSISGSVITGSPKSGYRYATPAYTVSSGNATVSQDGNAFTVTPTSDCTITINFEAIPTHTITCVADPDGSGTFDAVSSLYEGGTTSITANANSGYKFTGWSVSGTGASLSSTNTNPTTLTMGTANATVTATFEAVTTYAITYSVNGHETTINVEEDADVDLSAPASALIPVGYAFKGWRTEELDETDTDPDDYVTSATSTADITYYAIMAIEEMGDPEESLSQTLQYDSWTKGGSSTDKTTYRLFHNGGYVESSAFDLSKLSKVIVYGGTFGGDSYNSLTIGDGTNTWKNVTVSGKKETGVNTYTDGTALTGTKALQVKSTCGSTAKSESGVRMSKVEIYITETPITYSGYCSSVSSVSVTDDVTIAGDLNVTYTLTITSGNTLKVNGTLTNTTASNLVIEDGGQLITNSSIPLTYKKQITSATKDGGWYTISTPVHTPSNTFLEHESVENLILASEQYDFFYYDEPSNYWRNYKKHEFDLNVSQGYLYRNNGAELHFAGYNNQATYYEIALSYASTEPSLLGFNLIGNPYPQNITMSDVTVNNGGSLTGGYVLSNAGAWSADVAATIAPTQGFLVQIDKTGVTARITKPAGGAKSRSDRDYLKFIVANSQYEDAAFALFEEGYGLNKIDHRNSDIPMLYIPKDRDIFAIATMDNSTQSFNLNFKAKTTGKYTLSYEATGEYSYLHVIDRLTGEDVDMLLEGEYSFIASPSDNENRFIVNMRHSNNAENSENSIFAYQNGNDIVVNGEGELQIFDVMGRMVGSQRINGVQTINIPLRGVYIFRLNEKTQKIVVE